MASCRICGNARGNEDFLAKEMMFGTRAEFAYFQCNSCRCLQIRDIPDDMTRHYPQNYYSMQSKVSESAGRWRRGVYAFEAYVRRKISNRVFGPSRKTRIFEWMIGAQARRDSAILDVGCGRGKLLHELSLFGFRDLSGADPFVQEELRYDNGVVVHKCELAELQRRFDVIMMHHTFEHVVDPESTLRAARERLNPGRFLVLRTPVADCFAWRHYGVNWFALDAPRHFHIQSPKSLAWLAERTGFRVEKLVFDSGPHQFWGSEQYQRDIPHRSPRSHEDNPSGSIFSRQQLREFARRSRELNARGDGDSACFYLRRL